MSEQKLKYGLEDKVPVGENLIYGFQQIVLFVASAVVMPVVVGYALGLSQDEVAATLQRTFVLCGVMTILQVRWGHRFPIQDGPAGLWSALFLLMVTAAPSLNMSLAELRTNLEMGMLLSGLMVMILSAAGLVRYLAKLFTPLINGLLILLMVLQISSSIMKGMLGVGESQPHIDGKALLTAVFTMVVILVINQFTRGFLQSIATFVGMVAGWIFAALLGMTEKADLWGNGLITLPKLFAWGTPTFDAGVVVTCLISAFVLISMVFASISGMAAMAESDAGEQRMRRSIFFHGMSASMTGLFSSIAFMPFVSSIGVVEMTGVAARGPMYLAAAGMIVMGLVGPFGALFATIPAGVGNGALIIIFALCIGQALREFGKVSFGSRENLIVGLSMIIGTGTMLLPEGTFTNLPTVAACLLSNGLIMGMAAAFLLEHLVLPKKETGVITKYNR